MFNSLKNQKQKSNNNIYYYNMNFNLQDEERQLKSLKNMMDTARNNDPKDLSIPRRMRNGGRYTNKFLKWNKKMIRQDRTFFYAGKDEYFNIKTKRFNKIKYDKRYKKRV